MHDSAVLYRRSKLKQPEMGMGMERERRARVNGEVLNLIWSGRERQERTATDSTAAAPITVADRTGYRTIKLSHPKRSRTHLLMDVQMGEKFGIGCGCGIMDAISNMPPVVRSLSIMRSCFNTLFTTS